MQYLKESTSALGASNVIVMEHKGEQLAWNISTYRNLKVEDPLIVDINNYWIRLPEASQDAIWNIYKEIKEVFDTIEVISYLDTALQRLVKELFEYHKHEDIMESYRKYSKAKISPDLLNKYVEGLPESLTYLKPEHHDLNGMTIVLKIMIPIWGSYINIISQSVGTTLKEYRSATLLRYSNLIDSPPYQRLKHYIETYWDDESLKMSSAAIVGGIDKSTVPSYLLGNALVRRIAPIELVQSNQPNPPTIVITAIFNYINNLIENMDKQFGGIINEKNITDTGTSDEDNTSVIENYKIKQEISEGILVMHEVYIKDKEYNILKRILDDLTDEDWQIYQQFRNVIMENITLTPTVFSKSLCKWVLDPIVTAKILDYVDYEALFKAHAMTAWLLYKWGYHAIAAMVLSNEDKESNQYAIYTVVKPITKEQLDILDRIYPYSQNITVKRGPSKSDRNVAVAAIRLITKYIYSKCFELPLCLVDIQDPQSVMFKQSSNIFSLKGTFEIELADLIIYLKTVVHKGKYGRVYEEDND